MEVDVYCCVSLVELQASFVVEACEYGGHDDAADLPARLLTTKREGAII
jgi:hypothetical protein